MPVTASSNQAEAHYVTDGSKEQSATWNAGAPPPQTVEIDLRSPRTVTSFKLVVEQNPPGLSHHMVTGIRSDGVEVVLATFRVPTIAGAELPWVVSPQAGKDISRIRVHTPVGASGSWVAWREIDIFGI